MTGVGWPLPQTCCLGLSLQLLVFYPSPITVAQLQQRRDCLEGWAGIPISAVPLPTGYQSCSIITNYWEALHWAAEIGGDRKSKRAPLGKGSDPSACADARRDRPEASTKDVIM